MVYPCDAPAEVVPLVDRLSAHDSDRTILLPVQYRRHAMLDSNWRRTLDLCPEGTFFFGTPQRQRAKRGSVLEVAGLLLRLIRAYDITGR